MTREPEWSDWRIFLAVARHGSTLGAGKALRISQSTAARRISALEEALGVRLFERRAHGYRLTDAGTAVLPMAEALEGAALAAETGATAQGAGAWRHGADHHRRGVRGYPAYALAARTPRRASGDQDRTRLYA
jgi:DNA-binding transcriptional LysR family regulator